NSRNIKHRILIISTKILTYQNIRSILYTAITRARELLIIVGREETVAAMVENAKKNRRYTGLKLRLQGKTE
ncbi:MAG: hypothetical protein EGQ46_07040, partial [Clostridiales bacterium]|nr:hypothetical protein [Clostridiales bacterium]